MRYGLPALVLTGPNGAETVAGWEDWSTWEAALEAVAPGMVARAKPLPTAAEAFAHWPLLTRAELDLLCGSADDLPEGTVEHSGPGGQVWLTPAAASAAPQ